MFNKGPSINDFNKIRGEEVKMYVDDVTDTVYINKGEGIRQ